MSTNKNSIGTLYFDGQCSLCNAEMCELEKSPNRAVELVDIHELPDDFDGPSKEELLRVLHLRTPEGEWILGLDADLVAWRGTRIGWLLVPLRWPIIRDFIDFIYYRWADRRYHKKYGG